ncbi:MAG TPA: glycosyltransferase family 87 protein [Gaiellaceae bacterium]|nr:glycosyltransferase family 87 protein [Gaiellaceae bacterium]
MTRGRGEWTAAAVAAVLFGFSFYALVAWLERGQLSDVGLYVHYSGLVRGGGVPYRDFALEYPPAALPPMLLPAWMGWSYVTSFAVLMGVCGAGCIAAATSALRAVGAEAWRTWAALLTIGVSPLVLGSLFDTRFDLWPTLLAVAALAAVVRERPVAAGALLGLGFAAKIWPAVLLPIAVAHLWRRRGRAGAIAVAGAFVAVAAACFVPFAILGPAGLRAMFADQLGRPLQVESLGAAVLMAAQRFGMAPLATVSSHGAQALSGRGAGLAATLSTVLEVTTVLAVWILFARRRHAGGEAVLLAAAAAVAALVAFDRVLSPQYLIWLAPFVPLVRGARGFLAGSLLVLALGLTQTWFPWHYWSLALDHAAPWSWYLLARDVALVALAGVLLLELGAPAETKHGLPGRALRRAAASSVARIALPFTLPGSLHRRPARPVSAWSSR